MKRQITRRQRRKAFTLMELLLVMAILIGLASVVTVSYINIKKSSDRKTAKFQIEMLEAAVNDYYFELTAYPDKLEFLKTPPSDQALAQKWQQHGEFLTEAIPKDPWNRDYIYTPPNAEGKISIRSWGPDGQANSDDDITNTNST
ncbi:MAG: type II secretion system major pseudopilin GspG [Planctomycetes bacterium]|nr:type II secretion system major pseudopilin GspG [Planctomycetota bacterium]